MSIIKKILFTVFLMLLIKPCYSQLEVRDSVFVRIDRLNPESYSYSVFDFKINGLTVLIKNKYEKSLGFVAGYSDSKLFLKKRENIPKEKVLSYDSFNDLLNEDFLKVYFYYKIYFIISEDRYNYLTLNVRPILPPELNKQ